MTPLLTMSLGNYIVSGAMYIKDGPTTLNAAIFIMATIAAVAASYTESRVTP